MTLSRNAGRIHEAQRNYDVAEEQCNGILFDGFIP